MAGIALVAVAFAGVLPEVVDLSEVWALLGGDVTAQEAGLLPESRAGSMGSGREIAVASGMGETFVGTALLALSTSLPELVASTAAVRIGAHDLAVGNLFGSNAFNMAALALVDVAYTPAALLRSVDPSQAVAGTAAILMMALALAALVHGTKTRVRRLEPDAVLLLVVYAGALLAVWSVRP